MLCEYEYTALFEHLPVTSQSTPGGALDTMLHDRLVLSTVPNPDRPPSGLDREQVYALVMMRSLM